MSASESSSTNPFPQYRVRRKPPPTIDIAEKYPSPDPQDPFAPLSVLRNRTSSAVGQNHLATKDTPSPYPQQTTRTHQGPHPTGKSNIFKTSAIQVERRRSNSSYLSSHPTTTYGIPPRSSSTVPHGSNHGPRIAPGLNRLPSQSGPTTPGAGASHPPTKAAHPPNSDSTQRSNSMSRTDKQLNDPQLVYPQPRAPGNITRRMTVDMRTPDNSSGNETESELSVPTPAHRKQWVDVKVKANDLESQGKTVDAGVTTTISFNVGVDVNPAPLQRVASNGTTSTGSASLAKNVPPQQSRLAKFWLSKKTSHDGYIADGEKRRAKPNSSSHQKGPVHKLSISAPLTDTFVHGQGRSRSQQSKDDDHTTSSVRNPSRSRGGYTSDTDFESQEGTGGIRLRGVLFKARKQASTENVPVRVGNATPEGAAAVILKSAEIQKSKHPDAKEAEKRRPEMSWAEVNMEEYYTPVTSPRGSYPTPAPSPQLKPALELDPEEDKVKGGTTKKESNGQEPEDKDKRSATGVKANPEPAQAPRVRKLKATKTSRSAALNPATIAIHPPTSSTSTPIPPPPPPPKMFKRHTSSSTPGAAVVEGTDSSQLPSTQSISNTSIVYVSLISGPKPTEPPLNEDEGAGAFVKPRKAPRPPVEGVQSEPELLQRERLDDLRKGRKEAKQLRKDKQDGREPVSTLKSRPTADDEAQAAKHQSMDGAVKDVKVPEVDSETRSRAPISFVKHGKAASADFGTRKDKPALGVGRTEGSDVGVSKKVPASVSTPVGLSSKEHEAGCFPQSHPLASRSIFQPKGASPDNSFNSLGVLQTEYSLPTRTQLSQAASLPVYAEDGGRHPFGSLFRKQKTVIVFIRHFWCPLCQDYMSVVKSTVRPDMIVADGWMKTGAEKDDDEVVWKNETKRGGTSNSEVEKIGFVVISNGAHGMIAKYRQIFSLPFRVYTDPSLSIYKLLGMGKTGMDCQDPQHHNNPTHYLSDTLAPSMPKKKHNYSLRKKADTSVSSLEDKERDQGGGYVKHGFMGGIARVVVRAIKVGMPVWEKGGDVGQLGGEFVLGPGMICTYAHKMQSSKGHAPIEEVLQAAGVKLRGIELPNSQVPPTKYKLAQNQTDSIDLASPPRPSKEARHPPEPVRNRKDSFKETVLSSRSSTAITNPTVLKSISRSQPGPSQRGERERRIEQSPSTFPTSVASHKIIPALPPALKVVMTREEETRWAEERQRSIDRAIHDRGNNVKRVGALGRSPSSQGQGEASARSAQGGGGYAVPSVTAKEGRGNTMTESRSAPTRPFEEEERIVYKAEGRRTQERTRGYDVHSSGSGYVHRVSTSRAGHTATSRR